MVPDCMVGKEKFWSGKMLHDQERCWIEKWQLADQEKLIYNITDIILYFEQDESARWYLRDVEWSPFGERVEDTTDETFADLLYCDSVYALTLEELLEELKEKVLHDYLMASRHLDQLGVIEYYIEKKMEEMSDKK